MTKPGASTQARALAGTYNRGIGKPKIKPRRMWAAVECDGTIYAAETEAAAMRVMLEKLRVSTTDATIQSLITTALRSDAGKALLAVVEAAAANPYPMSDRLMRALAAWRKP